jgi:agmatine deiminase
MHAARDLTNSQAASVRFPAEWEPQASVCFSWPQSPDIWPGKQEAIQEVFAKLVALASQYQSVLINAAMERQPGVLSLLRQAGAQLDRIRLLDIPTDDVWLRDHGPIAVKAGDDAQTLLGKWRFNAWGGKFPHQQDDAAAARMAQALQMPCPCFEPGYVLEGGAVDSNGAGTLLTTEPVLLHPNRNPSFSLPAHLQVLKRGLGTETLILLPAGLPHDDTDGHVDNVARFVSPTKVLCCEAPEMPQLENNSEVLKAHGLQVQPLPVPSLKEPVAASYANFILLNGAVVVPAFQAREDAEALELISRCFADRQAHAFDCRLLIQEGGGLHCATTHIPA